MTTDGSDESFIFSSGYNLGCLCQLSGDAHGLTSLVPGSARGSPIPAHGDKSVVIPTEICG